MPTDEEVIREGMLSMFCETHNIAREDLSEEAGDLVIERLRIMQEARDKFQFLFNHDPNPPAAPGQLEYLTFMLDQLLPANTVRRLELDVKFAQLNLDIAQLGIDQLEESRKPKLVIPGVSDTAAINGSKNHEG